MSQKIEICSFLLMPPSKTLPKVFIIIPPPRLKETHSSRTAFCEDLFFLQQRDGSIMELKRLPKLNRRGNSSQVLINSTIFATFTFLVSVLLCHNLDSSMLKCEGSLSYLIKFLLTIPPINILNLYPYIFPILKSFIPLPH